MLCYPRCKVIDWDGQVLRDYDENLDLRERAPSARLLHLLKNEHWCHPVLGLIRTEALRGTQLMGSFIGADDLLLVELALQGEFHEIPERLFYRRTRNGGSPSLQQPTPEQIAAWYDPSRSNWPALPHSRLLWEHVQAILRSSVGPIESAKCVAALVRGRVNRHWRWPDMKHEWVRALRKATWDRWTVDAIRTSRHHLPHRIWAMASGLKKRDWARLRLAVSRPSSQTEEALLGFVAESLAHRLDVSARRLLMDWAAGPSEACRRAALKALGPQEGVRPTDGSLGRDSGL